MYVFPKPTVTKIQLQHLHVQMLGDFQVQKRQTQVFLSCGSIGGINQSCLIATFSTPLFLWRAEGWPSPHYSLQWEAETGSVERKDRERNPLELISINHSILEHSSCSEKKEGKTQAYKYRKVHLSREKQGHLQVTFKHVK